MGLLTKKIELILASQMINYYEELGYKIPRYYDKKSNRYYVRKGTTITIKIEDLNPNSHIKVMVKCDCCGEEKDIMYSSYCKRRNQEEIGDKYYCQHCASQKYISGENNHFWNPNLTDADRQNYHKATGEYNKFIRKTLARDSYTCQCCGKTSKEISLEVHHLDAFKEYEDKRTDVENAITLCESCHKAFHSWHFNKYGFENKGKCTKEQFEDWLGYALELLSCNIELPAVKKIYCIEEDKVYESAKEVQKVFKLAYSNQVYDVCNRNNTRDRTIKGRHFLFYDDYLSMIKEEIDYYVNVLKPSRIKQVRCITTDEIFRGLKDAERKYPQSTHIWDCCKGKMKTSGSLPDGTRLQWEYYIQTEFQKFKIDNDGFVH